MDMRKVGLNNEGHFSSNIRKRKFICECVNVEEFAIFIIILS